MYEHVFLYLRIFFYSKSLKLNSMARAFISENFNLVGSWGNNSIYRSHTLSWNGLEQDEDEIFEDVMKTLGSAELFDSN